VRATGTMGDGGSEAAECAAEEEERGTSECKAHRVTLSCAALAGRTSVLA